jgi:hypothetical protein
MRRFSSELDTGVQVGFILRVPAHSVHIFAYFFIDFSSIFVHLVAHALRALEN